MKVRTLPVLFTVASWVLSECLAIGGAQSVLEKKMNGSSMPTNFDLASSSRYHAEGGPDWRPRPRNCPPNRFLASPQSISERPPALACHVGA